MKKTLTYRSAIILSVAISLLLNLLFIIMFLYGREAVMPADRPVHPPFSIQHTLLNIISNFLLALILYLFNFTLLNSTKIKKQWKLLIIISGSLLITFLLSYIFSNIQLSLHDAPKRFPERYIKGGFMRDSVVCLIVLFSSQIMYLLSTKQQMELENKILLSENMKTRYEVLKNQVNPHFLFNTLNTLNSLIAIDSTKAQEYVQELSNVFRYTLQNTEAVTLADELKFTHSFCNLMQMRYGDNLKFEKRIDEKYFTYQVIPLSVQTLIENAIKHNVISNKYPLSINMMTHDDGTMSVTNKIHEKREQESEGGIGLTNLAERYKLKWGKEISITATDKMFTVIIPLIAPNNK